MNKYILKRLLLVIPTIIGITFITYSLVRFSADRYYRDGGEAFTEKSAAALNKEIYDQEKKIFGLDKPIPLGYLSWLKKAVVLDFGKSRKDGRNVSEHIIETLPRTVSLNVLSFALIYLIGIPLGIFLAVKKDRFIDHLASTILFFIYSIPSFWLALLLLAFLAGGEYFNFFPLEGFLTEGMENAPFFAKITNIFWHLVLPSAVLACAGIVFYSQFVKSNMIEVLGKQYIIAARSRGVSEFRIHFHHAFRNSIIPLITMIGLLLPEMFGGSVIIESIFSIPGMGQLGFEAIRSRDLTVIMAITLISSVLTLIGILISDILYTIADPKIRLD